jgi:integrase
MGRRMSHSVKRPKSKFEQFRMAVPADLRTTVGKREWTHSLGTIDRTAADAERGRLIQFYKSEIKRLRDQVELNARQRASELVDRAFERLSALRGSMDMAIAQQLAILAVHIFDSWSPTAHDRRQHWGDIIVEEPLVHVAPVPSIDNDDDRRIFQLRAEFIEGRGIADGYLYRQLAGLTLDRGQFRTIESAVSYLKSIEPALQAVWEQCYDDIAERYLRRLTEHAFDSWPKNIDAALAPMLSLTSGIAQPAQPAATTSTTFPAAGQSPANSPKGKWALHLTEALQFWISAKNPGDSAITEANRSVARFVAIFGDMVIADITDDHVTEFRDLIMTLPPRTTLAQIEGSGRTLRETCQAYCSKLQAWKDSDRKMPEPELLAPATVKKDIGALSQILGAVAREARSGKNVAKDIPIHGYSKTKRGQKKPRLSLTPMMMQTLFDSPLFTGCAGKTPSKRHEPGPYVYQDELYWQFLFGVVSGPRLKEIGQVALSDIHEIDMRRTYGPPYEGHCTAVHITGTGEGQSTKNDTSERFVVIHPRLIDLGFDDYVAHRREQGETRLFDLRGRSPAVFSKTLSNNLNDYIDNAVTNDDRYVFHSLRHEFTDRAELSEIPARVANSIKGHATIGVADSYGLVTILAQYENLKKLNVHFIDWDRLMRAKTESPADPIRNPKSRGRQATL